MNLDSLLRSGDEVRCEGDTCSFISKIIEITDENVFSINIYSESLHIKPGDNFTISCITGSGMYVFEASAIEVKASHTYSEVFMKITSNLKRIQRRDTYRVSENIPIEIRRIKDTENICQWFKTSTIDISETGMLVKFNESCMAGEPVEFNIYINLYGINKTFKKITGTVVRCIKFENRERVYLLGVKFKDLPKKARNEIIRLVVRSQCNILSNKNTKRFTYYGGRGSK